MCSDDIFHSLKGAGLLKREVGPDYGREAVDDMLTFFHEVYPVLIANAEMQLNYSPNIMSYSGTSFG